MNIQPLTDDSCGEAIQSWIAKWKQDCDALIDELQATKAAQAESFQQELVSIVGDENGANEREIIERIFDIKHALLIYLGR